MEIRSRHLYTAAIVMVLLGAFVYGFVLMYKMDDRRTQQQKERQHVIGAFLVIISILVAIMLYAWWATWGASNV
jgi:uncharacterized membrane protein